VASWYEKVDSFLGGVLPGGVSTSTPFFSSAAEAAAGGVSGYPAPAEAQAYPMAQYQGGMVPAGAPRARGGKLVTLVARQNPDGTVSPVSQTPGGVTLYTRDVSAYKRVKRIVRKLARLVPRPRFVRSFARHHKVGKVGKK